MRTRRADFPHGFLFGTATSAYQIEGHAHGGAGPTHWDSFAATPGNVAGAETGARACDHYHRYAQDLDLAAGAGFDIYRFSTSWARIQPEGTGAPNPQGLDFYDRLVDAALARGLRPALTLYHWELPAPLADRGGWANRDIAPRLAEFGQIVAARLGDRLWSAAPVNEPWCIAWLGHFHGVHAPGLRDIRATARAAHHILLAHGQTVAAWRAAGLGNLGAVLNFEYALPAEDNPGAVTAAATYDACYNRFFLEALFRGGYPEAALAGLGPHLPRGWERDFDTIRAPLDWLGINYYTCKRLVAAPGPWPGLAERPGPLPKTDMGWEICPEGLAHVLNLVPGYTGDLPLYVTENGMAAPDRKQAGAIDDADRIAYLDAHLDVARAAIAAGVPLKGYMVWSLLDNYEWALGYAKRFGLVHVDFDSLARTPKASYHALARALTGRTA
ncbi:beta-glucosidase [Rhodovulum iodosum]|uniref:Beta-glucosidase n=1 Tax=Rhodovulum iodosum TaxID=68291 RepID=A0ABV3XUR4_9RHOB|nr:GH1 family beta-glucosidase [Rhodovulum robiginosum]RSK35118.1 beta-glucosidase [Rhodovulum robiginosum]